MASISTVRFAGDPLCVRRIIGRQAAGNFAAVAVFDHHRVAALKTAVDLADAGGKQAFAVFQGP